MTTQSIERMIGSVSGNWRPQEWLALRSNAGLDYTNRLDTQLCRFTECPSVTDQQGFKIDNRTNFFVYTLDAGATATRQLNQSVESQTTAGVQFYRNIFSRNGAVGRILPPGAITVTSGSVQTADESTDESRTLGAYVEQRVALHDRLFLTGAVRSDRNSAFGADFKTVFYPEVIRVLGHFRRAILPGFGSPEPATLPSGHGASGVQPGTLAAVQFFSATGVLGESGEVPGLVFSTLGNANLRPEQSTEIEAGVDGRFWNDLLSTE